MGLRAIGLCDKQSAVVNIAIVPQLQHTKANNCYDGLKITVTKILRAKKLAVQKSNQKDTELAKTDRTLKRTARMKCLVT